MAVIASKWLYFYDKVTQDLPVKSVAFRLKHLILLRTHVRTIIAVQFKIMKTP